MHSESIRLCRRCGTSKPLEAFKKRGESRLGTCKSCYIAAEDQEKRRLRSARYTAANREKTRAAVKRSVDKHRARRLASTRRYREQHREELRAAARAYVKANLAAVATRTRNRRRMLQGALGSHSPADVRRQYAAQRGRCYWCSVLVRQSTTSTM